MTALLATIRDWRCPQCGKTARTNEPRPHTQFHNCPKLRGLIAPMVPAGTSAKIELKEREDYVNGDKVQLDPEKGRPVMSLTTTTDKGQDVRVYAPAATGLGRS